MALISHILNLGLDYIIIGFVITALQSSHSFAKSVTFWKRQISVVLVPDILHNFFFLY